MTDPKDLLVWYRCTKCGNVQEHPGFLRSIPACEKCGSLGMAKTEKRNG